MEQIFPGGRLDGTVIGTGHYNLNGSGANTLVWRQMVSADGYIKELRVVTNIAPGLGKEYNFTVELNGVLTLLTVKIAGAVDTSGANMTIQILVAPGDTLGLYVSMVGAPVAPRAKWSSVFESINPKESLTLGGYRGTLATGAVRYSHFGGGCVWSAAEGSAYQCVSANGVIRDLYVELLTAPGALKSWTFALMLNGVATGLSVKIEDLATTGNNTLDANAITVVPGDYISLRSTPAGPPAACAATAWGAKFVADVDGESLLLGGTAALALNILNVDRYWWINSGGNTPSVLDDSTVNRLSRACILSNLYVQLRLPPGAGATHTFMLRKETADTTITCAISGAVDTAGHDTTNTVNCLLDEVLCMKTLNAGAPTAFNQTGWGLKMFIQPKEIIRNLAMVRKLGLPTPINIGMGI